MRSCLNIQVGDQFAIDHCEYEFHRFIRPQGDDSEAVEELQFVDPRTGRIEVLSQSRFLEAYSFGKVQRLNSSPTAKSIHPDFENEKQRRRREQRLWWTTTFDTQPSSKSIAALRDFIEQHAPRQPHPDLQPSPQSLQRWVRERGKPGHRTDSQMGDRRTDVERMMPWPHPIEEAYVAGENAYWTNRQIRKEDVIIKVQAAAKRENNRRQKVGNLPIGVPSRSTIWRRLQAGRTYENLRSREGKHVADRLYKAVGIRPAVSHVLDEVVIDHTQIDVMVCDPSREHVIGRAWWVQGNDVKSRVFVGGYLSFSPPSVNTIGRCIERIITGYPSIGERFPSIENQMECFGLPRTIILDNAWENVGTSLERMCRELKIGVRYAPVRKPEYKGIVERDFQTLNTRVFHKLPGAVFDNPLQLRAMRHDPQKDAILTLNEVEELILKFRIDVQPREHHTGLDDIPLRIWRKSVAERPIDLVDNVAAIGPTLGTVKREKRLSRQGVQINGLRYCSPEVGSLLQDLLPLQDAKTKKGTALVTLRYCEDDLSRIFVWNDKRSAYVQIPCVEHEYANGLTLPLHKELRSKRKEAGLEFQGDHDEAIARDEFNEQIFSSFPKMKLRDRTRHARMQGYQMSGSTSAVPTTTHEDCHDIGPPPKGPVRNKKSRRPSGPSLGVPTEPSKVIDPFADMDRAAVMQNARKRNQ